MSSMSTIVRVSQDISSLACVYYDAGFCQQAVLTGNWSWSQINATLYILYFAGNPLSTTNCKLCFALSHTAAECKQRGDSEAEKPTRLKAIETAVLALAGKQRRAGGPIWPLSEPWRLWNHNHCTYPHCRHQYVCSKCGGNHPLVSCPNNKAQAGNSGYSGASTPVY